MLVERMLKRGETRILKYYAHGESLLAVMVKSEAVLETIRIAQLLYTHYLLSGVFTLVKLCEPRLESLHTSK